MSEKVRPTINKVLFVSGNDLGFINHWPLEIRALFDPQAGLELAERTRKINQDAEEGRAKTREVVDEEIPF